MVFDTVFAIIQMFTCLSFEIDADPMVYLQDERWFKVWECHFKNLTAEALNNFDNWAMKV